MEKKYQGNKEMKDEKLMSKLKSVEIHLQLQSSCIKEAVVPVSRATEASSLNDAIDSLALKNRWPSSLDLAQCLSMEIRVSVRAQTV